MNLKISLFSSIFRIMLSSVNHRICHLLKASNVLNEKKNWESIHFLTNFKKHWQDTVEVDIFLIVDIALFCT